MNLNLLKSIVFIFLLTVPVMGQFKLSGKVIDRQTGGAIESVNVYFPELQKGTTTNEDGYYEFNDLAVGLFQLQFSYVGYKTQVVPVDIKAENVVMNVQIIPSEVEIGEVVVLGNLVNEVEKSPYKIEKMSVEIPSRTFIFLEEFTFEQAHEASNRLLVIMR